MDLKTRLAEDVKSALRARDTVRLSVLRMVQSDMKYEEIRVKAPLDDDAVIALLSRSAKKRRESIEQFQRGGRDDLVRKERKELEVLQEYLPRQLSPEEVKKIIERAINATGAATVKDMGAVMKSIMDDVAGQADGKVVSQMVREMLS
jgi:uncharacterized protein YqeY